MLGDIVAQRRRRHPLHLFETIASMPATAPRRHLPGGFMIFDDHGLISCPDTRQVADKLFATRPEVPLVLPTGQAVVFRGFER